MVAPIITISGVRPTIVALEAEIFGMKARAFAGLMAVAKQVQATARGNMAQRHYEGRAEKATTIEVKEFSPVFSRITVGIHGSTFAPEGKTFEVGWRSERNLQPPVAPLAEWAIRRGLASNERDANRLAFVIARAQGKHGYSFGEFHWLSDAWRGHQAEAEATIASFMMVGSWASQPRVPAGSPGGGRFLPFA